MFVTVIRHSSVPCPKIPNHDVSSQGFWLYRRPDGSSSLLCLLMNPGDMVASFVHFVGVRAVLGCRLLILDCGVYVRSQPEFGGTILNCEIAQRDVGDEVVRAFRMVIGGVFVLCLSHSGCVCHRCVGCQPVPDGLLPEKAV